MLNQYSRLNFNFKVPHIHKIGQKDEIGEHAIRVGDNLSDELSKYSIFQIKIKRTEICSLTFNLLNFPSLIDSK